ncbi:MAG: SpoIIE family protein phosphatase [Coleofasciculus sp. G1-WW12-02]|uniref:SpoIIE family protein phosphatase n=1 Tax=Coleofasciculus sp. G1-WW12-02 TaxID=3068483 RepID=UPI0032F75CBD
MPAKILVVDDEPDLEPLIRQKFRKKIRQKELQFIFACNGVDALEKLSSDSDIDMVLTDINMPQMDGLALLMKLAADYPVIKAVILSAYGDMDNIRAAMNLGAFDFLTKPINFQDLEITTYKTLQHVQQLKQALAQENYLKRLEAENLRLSTELDITRRLQQMLLPTEKELRQIQGLDIAGYMQPADEVGGDYYDVLEHNGTVKIGIGDITGHGLESGVLMLMVQTAVRTLLINNETNAVNFLSTLNQTIYQNLQRMGCDKNLSLALIDYHQGVLTVSGQHEQMIVLRSNGTIERIDTIDLGFPIGLAETIAEFVAEATVQLYPGDGVVLYTDGITEAEDMNGVQYGLERLCEVLRTNWHSSVCEIRQAVIDQVWQHIGEQKVHDDITLLILKQQ